MTVKNKLNHLKKNNRKLQNLEFQVVPLTGHCNTDHLKLLV